MPLQAQKWPADLGVALGLASLDRGSIRTVCDDVNAGRFGDWPAHAIPYSTVASYARREQRRRAKHSAREKAKNPRETIGQKTEQLAHRILDTLAERLDANEADAADFKDIADVLVKLARITPQRPSDETPATKTDPLAVALLGDVGKAKPAATRPVGLSHEPEGTPRTLETPAEGTNNANEPPTNNGARNAVANGSIIGEQSDDRPTDPLGWLTAGANVPDGVPRGG